MIIDFVASLTLALWACLPYQPCGLFPEASITEPPPPITFLVPPVSPNERSPSSPFAPPPLNLSERPPPHF